jgi:hypothetical protein
MWPYLLNTGRIVRLVASVPLLSAGLPPIVIPTECRREYIQLLARYELAIGTPTRQTGVWPRPESLRAFEEFVERCYKLTKDLVAEAY